MGRFQDPQLHFYRVSVVVSVGFANWYGCVRIEAGAKGTSLPQSVIYINESERLLRVDARACAPWGIEAKYAKNAVTGQRSNQLNYVPAVEK